MCKVAKFGASGNQSEPETLGDIIERLVEQNKTLFDQAPLTFVMDRGIATSDNIQLLRSKGYAYIDVERRPVQMDYAREFAQVRETFERIDASHTPTEAVTKTSKADYQCLFFALPVSVAGLGD